MRNYDYWKELKQKNRNEIILLLSGIFYRTFDTDARVLSDCFSFKIKQAGGYESVGFPKDTLEKYICKLKERDFGYKVYEKDTNNIFTLIKRDSVSKNIII